MSHTVVKVLDIGALRMGGGSIDSPGAEGLDSGGGATAVEEPRVDERVTLEELTSALPGERRASVVVVKETELSVTWIVV